jgi:hypothetical protein
LEVKLTRTQLRASMKKAGRQRGIDAETERLHEIFRRPHMPQLPLVEDALGRQAITVVRKLEIACISADDLAQARWSLLSSTRTCGSSPAPGGLSQAQADQPEQRTPRHSPRPDLHAPVLDELRVVFVQRGPDQDTRRLALGRAVEQSLLQHLDHYLVRQRGRVLEAQMRVHPARLRGPHSTSKSEANVA